MSDAPCCQGDRCLIAQAANLLKTQRRILRC